MMDFTRLGEKTKETTSGGGYYNFRVILQEDVIAAPMPDRTDPAITRDDFVFKDGKHPIGLYMDETEFEIDEDPSDKIGSDAYTNTAKGFIPGENIQIRRFVNEKHASKKMYVLVDSCEDRATYLFGKGMCCAASLKLKFKSGKKSSDPKGWEFTIKTEGVGVITRYEGVGAVNKVILVDANDTSPDVSAGTGTYVIPENSQPTEITTFDNAVQGSLITLRWNSDTNPSTISTVSGISLKEDFVPKKDATLTLMAINSNTFSERHRYIPE